MPRAHSDRRQEIRHLRRLARRSVTQLVLDDDLVAPEAWEPSFVEAASERELREWLMALSPDDSKDH